jgi:subtilisin family serine protease
MFRLTGRHRVTAYAIGLITAMGATGATAGIIAPNEIIRSLAPIEYLAEHSGGALGPSIDLTIPFALNSAKLRPEAQAQLKALGSALGSQELKDKAIEIAGHTDASGKADHNRRLSERRAATVAKFLVKTFGFEAGRFRVVGYGEDELKDPLTPEAANNRRVEISVIPGGSFDKTNASKMPATSVALVENLPATNGNDLRTEPSAAGTLKARARRDGSVRVIVGLEPAGVTSTENKGWKNLNDYVRDLQDQALGSLGWVNFNDLVRFEYTPAMAMTVDENELGQLLDTSAVTQVYEDTMYRPSLSRSGKLIGLSNAQMPNHNGKGVAVAVLDTGIDGNHPFLSGKVVAEACFGKNGRGRGSVFKSSCRSNKERDVGPGSARPCQGVQGCDHGTHVAGIVAGSGDEFTGVAAAAKIVAVQVFNVVEGQVCGKADKCIINFSSDVIRALEWIYRNRKKHRIAVVNLSLGSGRFTERCDRSPMRRIFALLRQVGIIAVAASGNSGFKNSISSPACLTDVVSVGATTYSDAVAKFSNSTAHLDFLAPGATREPIGRWKGILSSIPGGGFRRYEGTSMAAPHISGAFAALKSAVPKATVSEMIEAIRETGRSVRDASNGLSHPRIRVRAAIKKLRRIAAVRRDDSAPKPRLERKQKAKPSPQPSQQPDNVDGIRIINDEKPLGEDGKIKW